MFIRNSHSLRHHDATDLLRKILLNTVGSSGSERHLPNACQHVYGIKLTCSIKTLAASNWKISSVSNCRRRLPAAPCWSCWSPSWWQSPAAWRPSRRSAASSCWPSLCTFRLALVPMPPTCETTNKMSQWSDVQVERPVERMVSAALLLLQYSLSLKVIETMIN